MSTLDDWWLSVPGSTPVSEFLHQSAPDTIGVAYGAYVLTEKITSDRDAIQEIIQKITEYFIPKVFSLNKSEK